MKTSIDSMPEPKPVPTHQVCSLCDLDWQDHGDHPTALDCIRLLLKLKTVTPAPPTVIWPVPYYPYYYPVYPTYKNPPYQVTYTTGGNICIDTVGTTSYNTGSQGAYFNTSGAVGTTTYNTTI